jgi:hypothetical protein
MIPTHPDLSACFRGANTLLGAAYPSAVAQRSRIFLVMASESAGSLLGKNTRRRSCSRADLYSLFTAHYSLPTRSAQRCLPHLRHPPLIGHLCPTMPPVIPQDNLMPLHNLRPGLRQRIRQCHPLPIHQVATFPTPQLKSSVILKDQGRRRARLDLALHFRLRALVTPRNIHILRFGGRI